MTRPSWVLVFGVLLAARLVDAGPLKFLNDGGNSCVTSRDSAITLDPNCDGKVETTVAFEGNLRLSLKSGGVTNSVNLEFTIGGCSFKVEVSSPGTIFKADNLQGASALDLVITENEVFRDSLAVINSCTDKKVLENLGAGWKKTTISMTASPKTAEITIRLGAKSLTTEMSKVPGAQAQVAGAGALAADGLPVSTIVFICLFAVALVLGLAAILYMLICLAKNDSMHLLKCGRQNKLQEKKTKRSKKGNKKEEKLGRTANSGQQPSGNQNEPTDGDKTGEQQPVAAEVVNPGTDLRSVPQKP